jgi:hypothetical protein
MLISWGTFATDDDTSEFLEHARAAQAFYNTFFLNMNEQASQGAGSSQIQGGTNLTWSMLHS